MESAYIYRIVTVIMVAVIATIVTMMNIKSWYFTSQVIRSPQAPAAIWFSVIWTALYIMYAIVWCISYNKNGGSTDALFLAGIILNLLWVVAFFGFHNMMWSRIIILVLIGVSLYQAYVMWNSGSGLATFMMLVYASWIVCAAGLNFTTHLACDMS